MTEKYKKADRYVTFVPFEEETHLFTDGGPNFTSTNEKILDYGGEAKTYEGQKYYQYTADTIEKLKFFTNAYDLYYEAVYKGERFKAGVYKSPQIVLFSNDSSLGKKLNFTHVNKFEWEKIVDISEVEIIPVKEPIDLTKFLPSSNN